MNSIDQLIADGILDKDMAELSLGHTGQGGDRPTRFRSDRKNDIVDMMDLQVEYVDRSQSASGPAASSLPESGLGPGPTLYSFDHRPRPPLPPTRSASYRVDLDELSNESEDYTYYQSVKYHWLYSSQSYGWWHFSQEDNDTLEQAYQSGKPNTELSIGGHQFYFDFDRMIQRSRGRSTRNVLRVPDLSDIALRGVAGTRLDKDTVTGTV